MNLVITRILLISDVIYPVLVAVIYHHPIFLSDCYETNDVVIRDGLSGL